MVDTKKYSGSGSLHGLHVEVRFKEGSLSGPQVCAGMIVTGDWTRLKVDAVEWPLGTRNELWEQQWYPHAFSRKLMTYECAHAIAAQFAAINSRWSFLMEFRFVEEKIEYSYSHHETKESNPFSFRTGLVGWAAISKAVETPTAGEGPSTPQNAETKRKP